MKRLRPLAWGMLAVWASWITAVQAVAVSKTFLGRWTPDLSLLLVVGCAARVHKRDVVFAALGLAVARAASSSIQATRRSTLGARASFRHRPAR